MGIRSLLQRLYIVSSRDFVRGKAVAHLLHLMVPVGAQAKPDADGCCIHQREGETNPQSMERRAALKCKPNAEGNANDIVRTGVRAV